MGQRDGFRMSDLAKINAMYNCGNQAIGSVGGSYPSESNNPSTSSVYPGTKPSSGFTNPLAAGISGMLGKVVSKDLILITFSIHQLLGASCSL